MKEKILFVCQRYGTEVNGGAETECREYAERLCAYYDVEVLTTCALDHVTWSNYFPAGVSELNGVTVRRYPTDCKRSENFGDLTAAVRQNHSFTDERAWIDAQGPVCAAMIDYLGQHGGEYKAVIFMTYLYYSTVQGILTDCGTKILIPTAHDEWPIYLRVFDLVFSMADKLIFNSEGEKRFVYRRFADMEKKSSVVVGAGVVYPTKELPDVQERFGLSDPYVCYCGRVEPAKGCEVLFRYFLEYKRRHPGALRLVLTGKAAMEIPEDPDILPLGFVSEEEKFAVMQSARFLIQPSFLESLSIVTLESMMMGRPVLVNGSCEVLRDHIIMSNAGLYYTNYYEFEACLEYFFTQTEAYEQMCENGRRYVKEHYEWDGIIEKIHRLIEE